MRQSQGACSGRDNQRRVQGEAARSSQKITRDGDRVGGGESAKGRRRERNDESARRVLVFWERWRYRGAEQGLAICFRQTCLVWLHKLGARICVRGSLCALNG
jgi:hypothetical protein